MRPSDVSTLRRHARATLHAVELDVGDTLLFVGIDGRERTLRCSDPWARITRTTLPLPLVETKGAVTVYAFGCTLEVDGERHALFREVGTQRSFYEPWRVAGLHVWLDAVDDVFDVLHETHGACRPQRRVRLALQDASLPICPEPLMPWCPLPPGGLAISDCYGGENCWLGAYFGASAHAGLDVNHPAGTPIFAPLALDDHGLYETVYEGHGNNRWRGTRRWDDGSTWLLECHHVIRLTTPAGGPVAAGTQVARGAGTAVGAFEHSHFEFAVREGDDLVRLDPWILFWQTYLDGRGRADERRVIAASSSA